MTPRILFAGGCHVLGFPVGAEYSFASIALQSIQRERGDAAIPNVLGHLNFHSCPVLVDACCKQRTEFLVLQLGHYEIVPGLRKILGLRGTRKQCSCVPQAAPYIQDPGKLYHPTFQTWLYSTRRKALTHMLMALGAGERIFNSASIAASLDSILSALKLLPLRSVLLLSPFACLDPVAHSFRRDANLIFASAAREYGCIYIDTFGMLESYGKGKAFHANFADLSHLSRLGHERVGRLVGENLRCAVEREMPNQPLSPPDHFK